ncbi:MAG: peptidoglycan-binding domain-containing protein [Nannocystaceae bacterium]
MRRFKDCAAIPMAQGASEPVWPMPDVRPRFATWSLCGGRPFGCGDDCKRWHAGVDLVGAQDKALVVAPEAGVIVKLDAGWSEGSRAVFMRTDTGLFLVLGGTIAGSGVEFKRVAGERVTAGAPLGRVKGSYGMIHFETYEDHEKTRTHNSRWYLGEPAPEGLRNPLNYVQRAAGVAATMDSNEQRQQALLDLGYDPDPVGDVWGPRSADALKKAQADLGLDADGIWGPKTEEAIRAALDQRIEEEAGPCDPDEVVGCKLPNTAPSFDKPTAPGGSVSDPTEPPSSPTKASKPVLVAAGIASAAAVLGGIFLVYRSVKAAPSPMDSFLDPR